MAKKSKAKKAKYRERQKRSVPVAPECSVQKDELPVISKLHTAATPAVDRYQRLSSDLKAHRHTHRSPPFFPCNPSWCLTSGK